MARAHRRMSEIEMGTDRRGDPNSLPITERISSDIQVSGTPTRLSALEVHRVEGCQHAVIALQRDVLVGLMGGERPRHPVRVVTANDPELGVLVDRLTVLKCLESPETPFYPIKFGERTNVVRERPNTESL